MIVINSYCVLFSSESMLPKYAKENAEATSHFAGQQNNGFYANKATQLSPLPFVGLEAMDFFGMDNGYVLTMDQNETLTTKAGEVLIQDVRKFMANELI